MTTVDTCDTKGYSPLIPAVKAICSLPEGEVVEIVMNKTDAFQDLKEYLAERGTGFREIYEGNRMTVQFTITSALR